MKSDHDPVRVRDQHHSVYDRSSSSTTNLPAEMTRQADLAGVVLDIKMQHGKLFFYKQAHNMFMEGK